MTPATSLPRIAVGIATSGRAEILGETLRELERQTVRPDRVVVARASPADTAGLAQSFRIELLTAPPGLPSQRNAILAAVDDCDFLLLLDDDFLPAPPYIEEMRAAFATHRDIVVTTGRLLADGARGPGLSVQAARRILVQADIDQTSTPIVPTFNGYGCNMALRLDVVRAHGLRFDERLPLYAWYEDVDFCRRLAPHGRIVKVATCAGVHLGTKRGRTSGIRLGYSQVANPFYLCRKGSYPLTAALRSVARHLAMNGVRALWPEPWVDRRGRLRGNGLALRDLMRGRARPERILDL